MPHAERSALYSHTYISYEATATSLRLFFAHPFCYLRTFSFSFSLTRRTSDPRSINRLFFPLPTTAHAFILIARKKLHFLPTSTRVESCYVTESTYKQPQALSNTPSTTTIDYQAHESPDQRGTCHIEISFLFRIECLR